MQNLRLPPFGKVIEAYQNESIRLDFPLYIFVGQNAKQIAYQHKCIGTLCTYLPDGLCYENFRWPIAGQKVIIYDCGFSSVIKLKKMAHHLLKNYSPRVIFLTSESFPGEIFLPLGESYNG